MENNSDLFELGKIALEKQSAYLKLKIEKEVANETFNKEDELANLYAEWQKASNDYRIFFDSLNQNQDEPNDQPIQ